MLVLLDEVGICASAGPACHSGTGTPSHVLSAMGISADEGAGTIRLSLSRYTTEDDVDYALAHIPGIVERMRAKQST
jgi:cysteine desulfurase